MASALTAAPGTEPISVAEAKAHLRIDAETEDTLIGSLITSARLWVERSYGLALITQGWSLYLDKVPESRAVALPLWPLQAVTTVTLHGPDDGTIDVSAYAADLLSQPARLVFQSVAASSLSLRPLNGLEIAYTAGFGDAADDVPAPIRQALLLLVAHWYERREPVMAGYEPAEVPSMVAGLLAPYRQVRL
ncbi:head-tail connector protein [Methyloligella sp. 2.7D]|uniref:head-tail connector protein n=1 Tax=unclassified Methyloligella TaxID=2625955 RepID=UPI00157D54E0|nr:head-tail connector protein [Methyloligella sp. GL2]QKP77112.1 phage head-tail connector protein [Methyloligella sp. GL2]